MKLLLTGLPLRDRGLRFKLSLIMLVLFLFSLGSVFIPYYTGREALRREIEKSFLELSTAISVSVEQLTTTGLSEEDRLQYYVASLKKSGIREVSIVEENTVIDSTNPKAIGRPARIKLPSKPLVITASFGDDTGEKIQSKHLVIPVKVGGESLGYMHARFQIDDFTEPIRKNLYLRFFTTLMIFSLGLLLAVSIASHYVSPVERLALAAEKVAAGDLSQELPVGGKDEVGRLTRAFNEMIARLRQNRELEEKVRESQYLSNLGNLASGVAHEIRNPLNFIGLAVDHLDTLSPPATPEAETEKRQVIARIKEEIGRLNDLVTNFIMYGRPAEVHRAPVRMDDLLDGVLRMARERLAANGISCRRDFGEGGDANVDPDMIRRAALNLVLNAIEAMPNGGELRLSGGKWDEGKYSFVVEDTGVGIEEKDRARIFEPYFTTKPSGLGLGLILTKKIVDAHGGEILLESEPGKGTRIRVVLPGAVSGEGRA